MCRDGRDRALSRARLVGINCDGEMCLFLCAVRACRSRHSTGQSQEQNAGLVVDEDEG
jgi:hypothetical protein